MSLRDYFELITTSPVDEHIVFYEIFICKKKEKMKKQVLL